MTEAIIFIRYSTKRQEKGASRERQEEDCRAYCERMGWPVVKVVEDLGLSAYHGDHLKIGKLGKLTKEILQDLHHGRVLVAEKLDRFSRLKPSVTRRWVEDVTDHGVKVCTVSNRKVYSAENRDSSMMEDMELMMMAYLANQESEGKSVRVDDAKVRAFKRAEKREGAWIISAHCPGWLSPNAARNGWIIDDGRVKTVQTIYELSALGYGAPKIAKTLNEWPNCPAWGQWRKKHSTPTWDRGVVRAILEHPAVEGDYVVGATNRRKQQPKLQGKIVGYYPRIVDADLVARARESMNARKFTRGRVGPGVANLFSSLIRCGQCGSVCHVGWGSRSKHRRYLRCENAARNRGCTNAGNFNYSEFERGALDKIMHLALDDQFFAKGTEVGRWTVELADIRKAIADKAEQKQRLLTLYQMGDDNDVWARIQSVNSDVAALKAREARAVESLATAKGRVSNAQHLERVHNLRTALNDPDLEVRNTARRKVQAAMRAVVDQVTCNLSPRGEKTFSLTLANVRYMLFDNQGRIINEIVPPPGMFDPDGLSDASKAVLRRGQSEGVISPQD